MGKRRQRTPETASGIDKHPDDVLLHILSLLNPTLPEIARTSILSRRFGYLWRYTTCLDFDATTVLPLDRLDKSHDWYIAWVNNFIDVRQAASSSCGSIMSSSVKKLRIWYELYASDGFHIDKWINFAVANPVETFHLNFSAYRLRSKSDCHYYKLSKEPWLRAPSGLSNIKCLKSLFLSFVDFSSQFIDFILSSCPLLEDLTLYPSVACELDVSSLLSPLQLRRLKISSDDFALIKLCAPCLTSLYYESSKFEPQNIHVPMLVDLAIGEASSSEQPLIKYVEPQGC